jgi:hypothetical protein
MSKVDLLPVTTAATPEGNCEEAAYSYRAMPPALAESLKWNVPTYSLNGKNIMDLQDFRGHVNLNFFRGTQLRDPRRILQGTGKQVRHVSFRSIDDIRHSYLKKLVDQATINV